MMLSQINSQTTGASTGTKEQAKYTFTCDESSKSFSGFNSLKIQDNLAKWGMKDNMYMARFHYDQVFREQYDSIDSFLLQFFNSQNVNATLKTKASNSGWGSLGAVEGIKLEKINATSTSLDVFDRLVANRGIIRPDGEIKKCFEGFLVSDELRKCLARGEESSEFTKEQRNEFIHHVFKVLALGGWICQYEEEISEYLETTKLISVRKNKEGALEVTSRVYKVLGFEKTSKCPLFSSEHMQNFCYVSIKGIGGAGPRVLDVWYHAFA